jgi:transcriptional regulator of acetoin/glycerol metabolism
VKDHRAEAEVPPSEQKAVRNIEGEERETILDALIRNQWSRKRAARELGVDRTTLWRKMKRLGIQSAAPE